MKPFTLFGAAVVAAVFGAALFGPTPAVAQTRVFVSGMGSDSNPCSLSAPCRSFQQAETTVVPGGEVVALDAAGYGPLNITKAVTISAVGIEASITSNSTTPTAITINAGPSDAVSIRGLTVISGFTSGDGIDINTAKSVTIQGCTISGFPGNGISVATTASTDVELSDITVSSSGIAGLNVSPTMASGALTLLVTGNSSFNGSGGAGVGINGQSATGGTINATLNVTAANNVGTGILVSSLATNPKPVVMITSSKLANNGTGLVGNSNVLVFVDRTQITGNLGKGWQATNGGTVNSYKDNEVNGNGNDGFNGVVQVSSQ